MTSRGHRRGRILEADEIVLTVRETAALLTAAAHSPSNPAQPATPLDEVLARLWGDLAAVNQTVAHNALHDALEANANIETCLRIATVLSRREDNQ